MEVSVAYKGSVDGFEGNGYVARIAPIRTAWGDKSLLEPIQKL